jgi:hypoxanthine phosphoribosyltransferase
MTKVVNYTWDDVERAVRDIAMQMYKDNWRPDYIVGITRGGLVPAVMLSHISGIPMHTLCVQLATEGLEENTETNCWMSEDAFGFVLPEGQITGGQSSVEARKQILIIDDINRGGDAMEWIMKDWSSSCLPNSDAWEEVWHTNVRFAALIDNANSKVSMDYQCEEFNDVDNDTWVSFPWER